MQMQCANVATSPLVETVVADARTNENEGSTSDDDDSSSGESCTSNCALCKQSEAGSACSAPFVHEQIYGISEAQYDALLRRLVTEFRSVYFARWAEELRAQRPSVQGAPTATVMAVCNQMKCMQAALAQVSARCDAALEPWDAFEERVATRVLAQLQSTDPFTQH